MSDRPTQDSSRPVNRNDSNTASPATSSPPIHAARQTSMGGRNVTSPTLHRHHQIAGHPNELPPIPSTTTTSSSSFVPSATRVPGVSSILNPIQPIDPQENRRRKASHLQSPASSVHSLPPIVTGAQGPHLTSTLPAPSPSTQYSAPAERGPRRILTPRSPSLNRAASLSQLNPLAGSISAQERPFPPSPRARVYAIEPGTSGAPPLPTPPAAIRAGYGFPVSTPPAEAARRASTGVSRPQGFSASASPSTSYSSYSHAGHPSPGAQYASASLTTLSNPYTTSGEGQFAGLPAEGAPSGFTGAEHPRALGIPISSSGGQNVYQMMTLETTSGTVQLPVDVQAASRVADEKRRRNAGASARFRQRRKEKEKEASTSISRLEQQVKELGEDAEFYRRERDFLAGILSHVPGGERHFPRPLSPRQRRSSVASLSGLSASGTGNYTPGPEQIPQSPEEGRNVRRRTSTFSLPPPQQQPQAHLPPPGAHFQPSYVGHGYGGALPAQPGTIAQQNRPGHPLPSPMNRGPLPSPAQIAPQLAPVQRLQQDPQGPPQILQPSPQTGPWNPYPSERRPSGPPNQNREPR